jgi:molecular chaperone DnaJ
MSKDYYKTLGVEKNASADEIKKAYRKLAHQHHPDKSGGDEKKFKEINEAYQVLGDAKKREQYDRFGTAFEHAQGRGGFGGFEGFRDFSGYANGFEFNMDDLGDMFGGIGDMFGFGGGGGRSSARSKRGSDMQIEITLHFKDAVFGIEKEVRIAKLAACPDCRGSGAQPGAKIENCPACGGSGSTVQSQRTIFGNVQVRMTCQSCGGEGKKASQPCRKCSGAGRVRDNADVKVKIPAGISDGESIRLSGMGEAGVKGGPAGDLYIRVRVAPDPNFRREGDDIVSVIYIGIAQAALGDKVDVETVDGAVSLKIPEGTQSGKVFKLSGKGVPRLRGRGRGDHLVEVRVKIPTSLNRHQREALKNLNI